MAEDFQAAVYGGSWWMPPRTAINHSSCSSDIEHMENLGPFWPKNMMDMKSKSSDESSDGSMVFQDTQKPGGGTTTMSPDSAFQTMAAVFSDSDWDKNMLFRVQEGMNTFSASGDGGLKAEIEAEHQAFTVDQLQSLDFTTSSSGCTTFPISSTLYGYPSSLVQSLFSSNSPPQSPPPPPPPPPAQPLQQALYEFQSNSNNPFLSASASSLNHDISSLFPSPSSQFLQTSYKELGQQEIQDLGSSAKKSPGELPFKRPRLETPSPLPTFKVRKDKLGDRITALQQLVSPFGKTDTASVLHEAIEYIKLLHDQLNILSAPYMKGATMQLQPIHDKVKDEERRIHDLRSQGLCLVPITTTFPVATEMASGFWTPSYDGAFK